MVCLVWIKKLILTVLVVLFIAGSAEIGLRISNALHIQNAPAKTIGNPLLVPSWQHQHQLKPLAVAYSKNPDTKNKVSIQINEWGGRGDSVAVPKQPGTFRILCLGDESTFAPLVDNSQTFCAELQRMLSPMVKGRGQLEVVNAGVPGHCPLLAYLQLKHSLLALQPDLVIYNFDMTDVADDYQVRPHVLLDENQKPKGCPHPSLALAQQPQQKICDQVLLIKRGVQIFVESAEETPTQSVRSDIGTPQGRLAWLRDQPVDWSLYINHALQPLVEMQELVSRHQAKFMVACIPKPWQISAAAANGKSVRAAYGMQNGKLYSNPYAFNELEQFCQQHTIQYFNPSNALKQQPQNENLFMQNAAAFSPRGHQMYAHQLANYIYRQYTKPTVSNAVTPASSTRKQ